MTNLTYKIGSYVELHPATDRWMMGDRFGQVVGHVRRKHPGGDTETLYRVNLQKSGKTLTFSERNIWAEMTP